MLEGANAKLEGKELAYGAAVLPIAEGYRV